MHQQHKRYAVASPTVPTPTPTKPVAIDGAKVGGLVWFADRSNGRTTEHLAKVVAIREGATIDITVRDQGVVREFSNVKPWGADSVQGWWKAQ